jgi:hypothetical protein
LRSLAVTCNWKTLYRRTDEVFSFGLLTWKNNTESLCLNFFLLCIWGGGAEAVAWRSAHPTYATVWKVWVHWHFHKMSRAAENSEGSIFKMYFLFFKISRIYVCIPVNTLKHKCQVTTILKAEIILTINAYKSPLKRWTG